jgi:hypothetical protein
MRTILGFCVVLAVANLTGTVEVAYAFQTPAAGRTAPPAAPNPATAVENAVQQDLAPTTTTTPPTTSPANSIQAPATPGTAAAVPSAATTIPATGTQVPTVPGTATTNPVAGAVTTPGNLVPGTGKAGIMNNQTYSSNYVPGTQPAMTPGTTGVVGQPGVRYGYVDPTGTTMAPGTIYQSAGAGTYWRTPTTTYSSMYVAPGYTTPTQTYYTAPTQMYPVRQRRGLFGGIFQRRNRQFYSTVPSSYTYGTAPGTYSYVPAPGTYTYVPAPY